MDPEIGRFKFELLSKYPHLSRWDTEIWDRFVRLYPDYFLSVDYDVVVGDIRENDEELSEEWERNKQYLGKYKIDVVGYTRDTIYIIEIKPKATFKALGQAIMLDYLYTRDKKPKKETRATIITDEIMPDMLEICTEHNIELIIS